MGKPVPEYWTILGFTAARHGDGGDTWNSVTCVNSFALAPVKSTMPVHQHSFLFLHSLPHAQPTLSRPVKANTSLLLNSLVTRRVGIKFYSINLSSYLHILTMKSWYRTHHHGWQNPVTVSDDQRLSSALLNSSINTAVRHTTQVHYQLLSNWPIIMHLPRVRLCLQRFHRKPNNSVKHWERNNYI